MQESTKGNNISTMPAIEKNWMSAMYAITGSTYA